MVGGGVFWWLVFWGGRAGGREGGEDLFVSGSVSGFFFCLFREAHLSRLSTAFPDSVSRHHASTECLKKWYFLIFVHSSCNVVLRKEA